MQNAARCPIGPFTAGNMGSIPLGTPMSTQYLPFVYGFSGEWTEHPSLVQLLSSFTVRSRLHASRFRWPRTSYPRRPLVGSHHIFHCGHVFIHVIHQGLPHVDVELELIPRPPVGHFADLIFHLSQVGTHVVEIVLHIFHHLLVHLGHVMRVMHAHHARARGLVPAHPAACTRLLGWILGQAQRSEKSQAKEYGCNTFHSSSFWRLKCHKQPARARSTAGSRGRDNLSAGSQFRSFH